MKKKWVILFSVFVAVLALAWMAGYFLLPGSMEITKAVEYAADGTERQTVRYDYEDGQCIRQAVHVAGGLKEYTTFEYENGELSVSRFFKADGAERSRTEYEANGNYTVYNASDNAVKSYTEYEEGAAVTYRPDGSVMTECVQNDNGETVTSYDAKGNVTGTQRTEVTYDGDRMVRTDVYEDGALISSTVFTYRKVFS